ncbi:MAG TPA: tripartite tricarboxylate transporter substrate binding protein [Burkholderiaceae bacterium]|nr:tripartite tricarboxylate transporter substrate binding protein [Burkholderiaceae bacterium]
MKTSVKTISIAAMAVASLAFSALVPAATATDFPTKPIRIISPHQSGSTTELFGRLLSKEMGDLLGRPIVIEQRPGAAGTIGAREVAGSKPDGYTGLMNASIQAMYPGMFKNLPFDPIKDFTPVGIFGFAPMVVVTGAQSDIKSFKDMLQRAKANPEGLSFASGGLGSLPHLVGELVNQSSNVDITHIAYNGTGQALTDVAGGHVDILYASVASAAPAIEGGKLRPLAVTSAHRLESLPDVPTIAESGIDGFDVTSWYALWVPKETPREVVDKLNQSMRDASALPEVQKRLKMNGVIASNLTADEFSKFFRDEGEKWLGVMKKANVEPK